MPDDALLGASQKILDVGVIGAVCILLLLGIAYAVRRYNAEQEAHQKTRDAWLADVKEYANIGESVRNQMQANTSAMQSVLEIVKERNRQ